MIKEYKEVGSAFEYKERQYYLKEGGASSYTWNLYLLQVAKNLVKKGNPMDNSISFVLMNESLPQLLLAVTFLDLPFNSHKIISTNENDGSLHLSASHKFLVLCEEKEYKKTDSLKLDVLISQSFIDPQDRFIVDEKDPEIKKLKKVTKFKKGKIYKSVVTTTNISNGTLRLKLMTQIPQGAIPVGTE